MVLTICPNPSVDTYAWLDDFETGGVNRITNLREFPGGKGTHIAMALNELGAKSTLLGTWAGSTGAWIREQCKAIGINTPGVEVEGSNRKCYTFRSTNKKFNNTELLEPGPVMTEDIWKAFYSIAENLLTDHKITCVSGSWPSNAPENANALLARMAAQNNAQVIFDCSGMQLVHLLQESFFGIHLNEDEAVTLTGSGKPEDVFTFFEDRKVSLIAFTRGKEGLWLKYANKIIHAQVTLEHVVSTVGSGDCLTAGIAYAISKGFSCEEVARYGVACGAANCLNENLGMLKKEDVMSLLPQVSVHSLSYAH